ncbi:MAG: hypothetical protein AAF711_18190, partial [Planctomycetota bacterium]
MTDEAEAVTAGRRVRFVELVDNACIGWEKTEKMPRSGYKRLWDYFGKHNNQETGIQLVSRT